MIKLESRTPRDAKLTIIVHSTGAGPDHHRLDRILALKKLSWSLNQVKQQTLANFPGGEDGLPILQFGRCFFCGSLVSTLALERLKGEPTLFPNGNCGMPLALAWWSNGFFRDVQNSPGGRLLQKYCTLISRQIADGRNFLQGHRPGLADVHSYAPLCALKECGWDMTTLESDPLLGPWFHRVANIGSTNGQVVTMGANDLLDNLPVSATDFPECDAIADKEIMAWQNQGTLYLWRSPLTARAG